MDPKISIIVPVYNTPASLLKRTLDSFSNIKDDCEILIVDDGSESNETLNFLLNLERNYRIIRKKNGGLGSARNEGLKFAKGEYVSFIDADDYVESNFFNVLYKMGKENNLDIVVGTMVATNGNDIKVMDFHPQFITKELEDKVRYIIHGSVCNKIFKRYLFNNIKFPENHLYYEDNIVLIKLYILSTAVGFTNETKYFYWFNPKSITRARENSLKRRNDSLTVLEMIKKVTLGLAPREKDMINSTFLKILVDRKYLKQNDDYRKRLLTIYERDELQCVANKVVPIFKFSSLVLFKIVKIIDFDNDIIKSDKILCSLEFYGRRFCLLNE